jgi:hypothetical protein
VTIRDYIKRRVRWRFGIAIASWLFVAVTGPTGLWGPRPGYLPFVGMIGFMAGFVSFLFIRCPKFCTRIGQTIAMPTAMRFTRWSPKVKYCPFCGVTLDKPMQQPAG